LVVNGYCDQGSWLIYICHLSVQRTVRNQLRANDNSLLDDMLTVNKHYH